MKSFARRRKLTEKGRAYRAIIEGKEGEDERKDDEKVQHNQRSPLFKQKQNCCRGRTGSV